MWVRVISGSIDSAGKYVGYFGILANVPAFLDMEKFASTNGYAVSFGPKHILALE